MSPMLLGEDLYLWEGASHARVHRDHAPWDLAVALVFCVVVPLDLRFRSGSATEDGCMPIYMFNKIH